MRLGWVAAGGMALVFSGAPALSATPAAFVSGQAQASAGIVLAQNAPVRRPPAVTVTPRQPAARTYPSPYRYDYPGPGYSRACTSWLEQEARPSGTVVVPRMHCEWVRG